MARYQRSRSTCSSVNGLSAVIALSINIYILSQKEGGIELLR